MLTRNEQPDSILKLANEFINKNPELIKNLEKNLEEASKKITDSIEDKVGLAHEFIYKINITRTLFGHNTKSLVCNENSKDIFDIEIYT